MLLLEIGLEFCGSVRTKSTEKYKHKNMIILYLELVQINYLTVHMTKTNDQLIFNFN